MKLCFPVESDLGLDSAIFSHFGSAPGFVLVDTETGTHQSISNGDKHHTHGACSPMKALGVTDVDALVVTGIGGGALGMLKQRGILVFMALAPTIAENLSLLKNGSAFTTYTGACSGHGHDHGCSH
jgi:predicted Fe-Mo cluster-binding NifX family protein